MVYARNSPLLFGGGPLACAAFLLAVFVGGGPLACAAFLLVLIGSYIGK